MGRSIESGSEEEDVAFEETSQTNGWQGLEGYAFVLSVSWLWADKEDASALSHLHEQ